MACRALRLIDFLPCAKIGIGQRWTCRRDRDQNSGRAEARDSHGMNSPALAAGVWIGLRHSYPRGWAPAAHKTFSPSRVRPTVTFEKLSRPLRFLHDRQF